MSPKSKIMTVAVAALVQDFVRNKQASWLEQGTVVSRATRLSAEEHKQFRQNLNVSDSTYRKFRHIGEAAPRLERLIPNLPTRWTTGYLLSICSEEELERVVTSGELSPK